MTRKLDYIYDGRSGHVVYSDEQGIIRLYYEFGAGNCVAMINVPTVEEWTTVTNRPVSDRDAILTFIAEQAISDQASNCSYRFSDNFIELFKK